MIDIDEYVNVGTPPHRFHHILETNATKEPFLNLGCMYYKIQMCQVSSFHDVYVSVYKYLLSHFGGARYNFILVHSKYMHSKPMYYFVVDVEQRCRLLYNLYRPQKVCH